MFTFQTKRDHPSMMSPRKTKTQLKWKVIFRLKNPTSTTAYLKENSLFFSQQPLFIGIEGYFPYATPKNKA